MAATLKAVGTLARAVCLVAVLAAVVAGCYRRPVVAPLAADAVRPGASEAPSVETPAPAGALTSDAAVREALAHAPELAALRARARAARLGVAAAGGPDDLELRVRDVHVLDPDDRRLALDLALRARPARPGERRSRRDEADLAADRRDAAVRAAEADVAAEARRLHAALTLAHARRALLEEAARVRAEALALVRRRVDAGTATALDAALAELDEAEVADRRAALVARTAGAAAALRQLLGWPPSAPVIVAGHPGGVPESLPAPAATGELVTRALAQRPELAGARARLAASEIALWRARSERWPWLGFVEAGWEVAPEAGPWGWSVALSLRLPLAAWGGGPVAARRAEHARFRAEHTSWAREVAGEVEAARTTLEAAMARHGALATRLLPAAERAEAAARRAAAAGAVDALRELQLRQAVLDARQRALETRGAVVEARIGLDRALGPP